MSIIKEITNPHIKDNTMRKLLFALPLIGLMAFNMPDNLATVTPEAEMFACTPPPAPDGILLSFGAPLFADARYIANNIPANLAGYSWTISGGYITSGQGTSVIYYAYDANSTEVTICVRAYAIGTDGRRCYSGQECTYMSTELN